MKARKRKGIPEHRESRLCRCLSRANLCTHVLPLFRRPFKFNVKPACFLFFHSLVVYRATTKDNEWIVVFVVRKSFERECLLPRMYPARSMSTITEGGRHRLRSTGEKEREGGRVCKWTAREGALICRWGAIDGRRGGCECSLHFAREWEPLTRFLALVSVALRLYSYSYRPSRITSTCRAALWLTNSCFLRIAVARLSPCHQYMRSS